MARFYFDVHDTRATIDNEGREMSSLAEIRNHAMMAIPRMVPSEIPMEEDRRNFMVVVSDEDGKPVYSAALSFVGTWLLREPERHDA